MATSGDGMNVLVAENDDALERNSIIAAKVAEREFLLAESPSRGVRSAVGPANGVHLVDHYAACIKLSAENKINSKNAFNLKLIDFMKDMLLQQENNNFQFASSTLDAGTKIYAGRVDAVYTDAFKILGGLGMTVEDKDVNDQNDGEASAGNEPIQKRRKVKKGGQTVCFNAKAVSLDKLDSQFSVDPYFQKTSAAFSETGVGGLLLGLLPAMGDAGELSLDAQRVPHQENVDWKNSSSSVDLSVMSKKLFEALAGEVIICPQFSHFNFSQWRAKSLHEGSNEWELEGLGKSVLQRLSGGDDFYDDSQAEIDLPMSESIEAIAMDNTEARATAAKENMFRVGRANIGELVQCISDKPLDYSYFNPTLLRSWAGPMHWKFKAVERDQSAKKIKQSRKRKPEFLVDFDAPGGDLDFGETKKSTTLSHAALRKYSKTKSTIPAAWNYPADCLFRLFLKKDLVIQRQEQGTEHTDVDDHMAEYNYNAPGDMEYCPVNASIGEDCDNYDDCEELPAGATSTPERPKDSDTEVNHDRTLSDDDLLQEPYRVEQLNLGYARRAKNIDMRRLKSTMWGLLSTKSVVSEQEDALPSKRTVASAKNFTQVIGRLPGRMPTQMADDLSTPVAFICLLHLANEKNLSLDGDNLLSDIVVTQET